MIDRLAHAGILAAATLVCGCNWVPPTADSKSVRDPAVADGPVNGGVGRGTKAPPPALDKGRYTSIDPAACKLIEQNIDEGGYSRHLCAGLAGYSLEISESDLRQDIVVIAPDARRTGLQLSTLVANGAFNQLGKRAEWRGGAIPSALIVRLDVAAGPEPIRPDISRLVVARLAMPACVVAVVPPGPDQNGKARRIADAPLPKCLAG